MMPFGLKNAPAIFYSVVVEVFKEYIHKFLDIIWPIKEAYGSLETDVS